jgi:hypothetical protein
MDSILSSRCMAMSSSTYILFESELILTYYKAVMEKKFGGVRVASSF